MKKKIVGMIKKEMKAYLLIQNQKKKKRIKMNVGASVVFLVPLI